MRFTIKREEFLKGLVIAGRAVSSRTPMPLLANFKIELNEQGLFITGSNFDLTIRTYIPYAKGEDEIIRNYKEGVTLINAKIITEIARKMAGDELTLEVLDVTVATVSDSRSQYRLNCVKAEEYPDLDLEPDGVQLRLPRADFAAIVSQTAFAAALSDARPALTAINLEAHDGVLVATATDGARMGRKEIAIPDGIEFLSNVPSRMMIEIDHLLEETKEIEISFNDKKALFEFENTVIATRLISDKFPELRNIVPRITNYALEVNGQELIKAIDRACILSIDRKNAVELSMSPEGVEISAKSSQVGSATEKIDSFRYEGQRLRISFGSEFVIDAIRALNAEDVTLLFVGEMKPFVIKNASDESVVQVVTPFRTY